MFVVVNPLSIFMLLTNSVLRNTIRLPNSLDPNQARRFVEPDLGPHCSQRLSADNTGRLSANIKHINHFIFKMNIISVYLGLNTRKPVFGSLQTTQVQTSLHNRAV